MQPGLMCLKPFSSVTNGSLQSVLVDRVVAGGGFGAAPFVVTRGRPDEADDDDDADGDAEGCGTPGARGATAPVVGSGSFGGSGDACAVDIAGGGATAAFVVTVFERATPSP
jgi:hypothetical protein